MYRVTRDFPPLITLLLITALSPAVAADLTLNMGFSESSVQGQFQTRITKEAFRRIGKSTEFIQVEAERALINANAGIEDGNLIRVEEIDKIYPNLRRVPEKLIDYDFVVFSTQRDFPISSWLSLQGEEVGLVRGWKIVERNLQGIANTTPVRDGELLMQLLANGRVDHVVYERWQGLALLRQAGYSSIHLLEPPVTSEPMYIYLHNKHESLIPALTQSLQAMKQDGSYQAIFNEVLIPLNGQE